MADTAYEVLINLANEKRQQGLLEEAVLLEQQAAELEPAPKRLTFAEKLAAAKMESQAHQAGKHPTHAAHTTLQSIDPFKP